MELIHYWAGSVKAGVVVFVLLDHLRRELKKDDMRYMENMAGFLCL